MLVIESFIFFNFVLNFNGLKMNHSLYKIIWVWRERRESSNFNLTATDTH